MDRGAHPSLQREQISIFEYTALLSPFLLLQCCISGGTAEAAEPSAGVRSFQKRRIRFFYAFFPLFARFFFSVLCCYEKSWHHEIAGEIERSQRVRAKDRKKHPSLCIAYLFPTLFTLSFSSLSMMHSNFHQLFPSGIRSQPTEENSYSKLSLSNMAAHNFLID